jgi:hypothetical protein
MLLRVSTKDKPASLEIIGIDAVLYPVISTIGKAWF